MILVKAIPEIIGLMKSYGHKDYSKLQKVPIVDKNGHTRMVYKKNKENVKANKNVSHGLNDVKINVDDIKAAIQSLKLKDPKKLIESFNNYSAKGKTDSQLFNDLRRLAVLNFQASKGYLNYKEVNDEIYKIKDNVIEQIVNENPKSIKIKSDLENDSENIPGVIYFEKDGKQISFHIYGYSDENSTSGKIHEQTLRKVVKDQEKKGVWNERPGGYLVEDYDDIIKLAKLKKKVNELQERRSALRDADETRYYSVRDKAKNELLQLTYNNWELSRAFNYPKDSEVYKTAKDNILDRLERDCNRQSYKIAEIEENIKSAKTVKTKKKYMALLDEEKIKDENEREKAKQIFKKAVKLFNEYEGSSSELFDLKKHGSKELYDIDNKITALTAETDKLINKITKDSNFIKKAIL